MGSAMDKAKGHAKEAIGEATDDRDLRLEGKADRAGGAVKEAAEHAKEKVEDVVDKVKDKLGR